MPAPRLLPRRAVLAAVTLGGGSVAAAPRGAEQASLLVAGPGGGRLSAWSARLTPPLLDGLPAGSRLAGEPVGGADGVTGANRFETQFAPDGTRLMLLPGTAPLAWLAGDPRVHFDAAGWLPLLCGVATLVLACRRPLRSATAARPLLLAVEGPLGAAAAALLALDLIDVPVMPVRGLADPHAALAAGRIDAALVTAARAAALPELAASYCLRPPDDMADADPQLPTLAAIVAERRADPALLAAWRAAAAAAQLDYALVMAPLSAPASVALWRQAAVAAARRPALRPTLRTEIRALAAPACNAMLGTIAADATALLAYRRWLANRLGWQPG